MRPRTFELVRYRDLSGVSGTGVVAEGCVFTDGSVALRWRGNNPATAVWPDLDSVLAVHGHEGATEVRWLETSRLAAEAKPRLPQPRPDNSLEAGAEALARARAAAEPAHAGSYRPELDLDHLFGAQHSVRPPTSIADPSGPPSPHARGWAGARHLR
ncbi:hypothetical protein GCM10009789_41140 [Kribbella sancticallisti]|uniref:Uncharacterized protein n=1 Tax=Kribbella sancticallisti TaxID=460087 RepID=A0ABN2DQC8_9ACTN